jgi:acylphosphatase
MAVKQGPPEAEVQSVEARWSEPRGKLRRFRIRWIGFL